MSPEEVKARLGKVNAVLDSMTDPASRIIDFLQELPEEFKKLNEAEQNIKRGYGYKSQINPLRKWLKLNRNASDDFISFGSSLRRLCDLLEPIADELAEGK